MSVRGLGKAITRAPQSIKQRFNMGEQTKDEVYLDAERRFKELETETQKLSTESKRYFMAVEGMLNHQIGFAKAMDEIFKPISGSLSNANSYVVEDSPVGIEASEQYRELVTELQHTLKPDLGLIEEKIIRPARDLLQVIKSIRKMALKRNHKQLDLDRRLATYKKYESKTNRTAKDEEKMYKAEAELQVAQQEYNYYNDLLKSDLPALFQLQNEFLKPLFVSFYFMQLNIFYTLYNSMQEMKIPYFDLSSDIMERFNAKRGNIAEQAESLSIVHFRVGYSKAKLEMTKQRFGSSAASSSAGTDDSSAISPQSSTPIHSAITNSYECPPPTYTSSVTGFKPPLSANTHSTAPSSTSGYFESCTALYDYTAQADGDLTFPAGAQIEILDRSDAEGWWTGRYNGVQGLFPGNYVRINKN